MLVAKSIKSNLRAWLYPDCCLLCFIALDLGAHWIVRDLSSGFDDQT